MMKVMALCLRALAAILRVLPVKNRVAFLSRQSGNLSMDYRMLMDQLRADYPDLELCTCINEPETKDLVSFVFGTLSQLKVASTSKVVIVDGYVPAVCIPAKRPGVKVVQLWHALGAVKRFGYQAVDTPAGRSSAAASVACMHEKYDFIVAGGPGAVECFAEAFGYDPSVVRPLGLPRVDYLTDSAEDAPRKCVMERILASHPFLGNGCHNVIYAPTLRKGPDYEQWLTDYVRDLASGFVDAGVSDDINLIITGHPLDSGMNELLLQEFPFVKLVSGVSTIDLLGFGDCVVTDYSAVAFEAGLAGKGVYFYFPDADAYRQSPGLNIDPLEQFPAESSQDAAELCRRIAQNDFGSAASTDAEFRAFMDKYFAGVGFGCTKNLATFIRDLM